MSEKNLDDSQWELSKENIQPIKQGRKASVLTNALNDTQQKKLNAERHEFEKELRAYTGNDPLDVWYKYVLWVEQNYPQGGIKGNLIKLIESCFSSLITKKELEEKYNNDERFLDLWIKYANLCPCPLEIYQTLYKKNMFIELANFYQVWAWELEKSENYKKANTVYLEGTQRKANPLDNLEMAYKKFQARIAQKTLEEMNSTENENSEAEVQRKVFSSLKAKGPKAKAPIERVATVIGSAGKFPSAPTLKTNAMGPTFKIFQDENALNDLMAANSVVNPTSGKQFVSHSASSKENNKNPSMWTKNKLKQTTTQTIHVEDVNQINTPSFQVLSDPASNDNNCATPATRTEFSGILSTRKNSEYDEWKVPLFVAEPFNPNAQPQYCKHLVYCGNEEFSFEELRALSIKEEEEKIKEEEIKNSAKDVEIKELREMLKRHEEIIASLMQKQNISEDLSEEKPETPDILVRSNSGAPPIILVTDNENNISECGSKNLRKSMSESRRRLYEDSWVAINKSVSFAANVTQNISHIHDESSTKSLLTLKPIISNKNNNSLSAHQAENVSRSPPSNNTTVLKDHSRSPTVNTKFAKNIVGGFFNTTLFSNCENSDSSLDVPRNDVAAPLQGHRDDVSVIGSNKDNFGVLPDCKNDFIAPFPIYSDEIKKAEFLPSFPVNDKFESGPSFPIYCDEIETAQKFSIYSDENEPPKVLETVLQKFSIYSDENEVPKVPENESQKFSIYCDENELPKVPETVPQKFSIYCDENEPPKVPKTALQKFSIYSDENDVPKECENATKFSIYCDENEPSKEPKNVHHKVSNYYDENESMPQNVNKENEISEFSDENQENIQPPHYHFQKEKRTLSGILKPSKDIPFIPLEEQKKAEEDDDDEEERLEGIEPLSENCFKGEDFTIKIPLNHEAFAKTGFVASTPAPWSLGFVPQVKQDGDDFTMAVTIKSSQRMSIMPEIIVDEDQKDDCESPEKSQKSSDSQSIDNSKGNSGELMPPPPNVEPELPTTRMEFHSVASHITTKNLSPILEASREYRSSTSSSSGSCSVFSTNSNLHGVTSSNVSRSINFSQAKAVSYGEHEPYVGASYNEYSKSGYAADKSRGESTIDHSRKRTKSEAIEEEEEEDFDTSFDPNKIAALLMCTENPLVANKDIKISGRTKNKLPVDEKKNSVIGVTQDEMKTPCGDSPALNSFSPLSSEIEYPPLINPFDGTLQVSLMKNLRVPVNERGGFISMNGKMPQIKSRLKISLSKEMYNVKRLIGSGAYAQVFHSSTIDPMNVTIVSNVYSDADDDDENESDESQMILKVQKPACVWEFYICHELRERLKTLNAPESTLNSFMRINRGYFFAQGSILVSQYHKTGTLVDIINRYKATIKNIPEKLIFFLMVEIISVLIALHSCNIIHGDLKPDNVLLIEVPDSITDTNEKREVIKFIDFGRSIDMSLYPPGTTFKQKVSTEAFTCCEMQENRPWTFQTDLFGLASIAHCMLWGSYMNVKKEGSVWRLSGVNYYRYMKKEFWQDFFNKMLNIPSCKEIPDLKKVLQQFEQQLDVTDNLESDLSRLKQMLNQR